MKPSLILLDPNSYPLKSSWQTGQVHFCQSEHKSDIDQLVNQFVCEYNMDYAYIYLNN